MNSIGWATLVLGLITLVLGMFCLWLASEEIKHNQRIIDLIDARLRTEPSNTPLLDELSSEALDDSVQTRYPESIGHRSNIRSITGYPRSIVRDERDNG